MSNKNLPKRPNSGCLPHSKSTIKSRKSISFKDKFVPIDEKHIHWKDPPVDQIHQYISIPRVHWKDPVVESTRQYSATRTHPPKLPPSGKTPTKGLPYFFREL